MEECLYLHEHCSQGTLLLVTFIGKLKELGYHIASILMRTSHPYLIFMAAIQNKCYSMHKCTVGLATLHHIQCEKF